MEIINMPVGTFLLYYVVFAVEVIVVVALGFYWYIKDSKSDNTKNGTNQQNE